MATIYDISVAAGVSLATVSRVINGNANVSKKTRERVLAAMKEVNYRPNSIAQSLASSRSNSVGVLVSELHGPFYGSMMSGIEAELRTAEKHVIIAAGHSEQASEKDGIEFLISRNCDALILHVEAVSDEYLLELDRSSTPFVLINRQIDELDERCVSLNNEEGGYLATRAALEKGHRQIAYISGPLWKTDAKQRYAGHNRALKEYGIEMNPALLYEGNFQEIGGSEGMQVILEKSLPFTAVVCANDEMASGAMNTLREHQLSIPEDVSVIGFDNIISAGYIYPKLTTVDYPVYEMGRMAARWILKNIYKKPELETQNVFEPHLVERDSVNQIGA